MARTPSEQAGNRARGAAARPGPAAPSGPAVPPGPAVLSGPAAAGPAAPAAPAASPAGPAAELRAARAALVGPGGPAGGALRAALTAVYDRWLAARVSGVDDVALVAVGGLGRREPGPHADLDLVLLHRGRRDVAAVADRIWYPRSSR